MGEKANMAATDIDSDKAAQSSEKTFDETVAEIVKHINANHANMLPFCACLKTCRTCMPYREAEAIIAKKPVMDMSLQNVHTLMGILIDLDAIEVQDIPEGMSTDGIADADDASAYASPTIPEDQPIDYTVLTSAAGKEALKHFDETTRFADLVAAEPETYAPAYIRVLETCEGGAALSAIEKDLQGIEALTNPKTVYPQYFVSKLETIGGLVWDGKWKTTEAGAAMRAMIG